MTKSNQNKRQERRIWSVEKGWCPIHGGMAFFEEAPDSIPYLERDPSLRAAYGIRFVVVTCPTEGCGIQAKAYGADGEAPFLLLPEWEYVVQDAGDGPYFPQIALRQLHIPLPLMDELYGQSCPGCGEILLCLESGGPVVRCRNCNRRYRTEVVEEIAAEE